MAEAAGRKPIWVNGLKGWNVRQSTVVNEWIEEGRVEGRVEGEQQGLARGLRAGRLELLEAQLTTKFGPLALETMDRLRALPDDQLKAVSVKVLTATALADLGL